MFKSGDERQSARKEREAERIRAAAAQAEELRQAEEQRKREEFLATPVGAATAAKEAGQAFFEVQLQVGRHAGTAFFGSTTAEHQTTSSAVTLGEIEKIGWHLEHASYYFMITSESSTSRVLLSGDNTAINGVTVGVYLFRNTSPG